MYKKPKSLDSEHLQLVSCELRSKKETTYKERNPLRKRKILLVLGRSGKVKIRRKVLTSARTNNAIACKQRRMNILHIAIKYVLEVCHGVEKMVPGIGIEPIRPFRGPGF